MCARSRVILIGAGAVLWHYDVVLLLLLQCCNQSEQHNAGTQWVRGRHLAQ